MPADPRPWRPQPDEELRRARRAFVRSHHPDRGGDPAVFAAGLRDFDALVLGSLPGATRPRPVVTVLRRPRGVLGWVGHFSRLAVPSRSRRPPRVR